MTHDEADNPYAGLLVDDAHWAFGAGQEFRPDEDPVATAVVAPVPDGVDRTAAAAYCLMLGDDALVLAQRLSEWCGRAPDLEEDIALSNIALDLLGQARLLLARAAAIDPTLPPPLPDGSPVPPEDRLAFFREESGFRNVRMVELPVGDFAETITRILLFSTWRLALFERLAASRDSVLAALAAKGARELAYHREFAARWFVTLAGGTQESRRRLLAALGGLWPLWHELVETHPIEVEAAAQGIGVDPGSLVVDVEPVLEQVFATAQVEWPSIGALAGVRGRKGRDGCHTEALSRMLAEMQVVARAHPRGLW